MFGTGKKEKKVEKNVEKEEKKVEKMQVKKKKEEKERSVSGWATKPSLLQAVCAKLCQ